MHVKVMSGFGIIRTSKAQNGDEQMIKRIQIKNFKCYGDPGVDFSLKRINFIFGDNSAGKSTFLQLLRMVLNNEGQRIDDNFKSLVFKGDESREIKMCITAHSDQELIDKCPIYDYSKVKNKKGSFEYKGLWSIDDKNIQKNQSSENDRKCSESRHIWLPHVIHQEAARPVRMSVVLDKPKTSLNEGVLLPSDIVEYVNLFFKALNVPYSAVDKGKLKDNIFGVVASTGNVGAGIDGLYETALKLYEWRNFKIESSIGCVEENSACALLALEEPESHVNERQISPLIDFIFKEAKDVVNGQIVVECHSELMALKLKNFLRVGLIAPEELAVFFATKTESGTVIEEIPMDEKGNFRKKWPGGGFFTERTKIVDEFFKAKASANQ